MSEALEQRTDVPDATAIDLVADIVSAYIAHNTISTTELPVLITSVHTALVGIGTVEPEEVAPQSPAVSIRTSVKPDGIGCLECGKRFVSLKRHISANHGLTTDEYRAKWKLKSDYPMVAPAYAEARSQLAKKMGLGQKGRQRLTEHDIAVPN